jgi:peptidoglycan/LPS O-acetylase OafA/YrhL
MPTSSTPIDPLQRPAGYLPALNGVRAIAVLLVLAHNFLLIKHPTDLSTGLLVAVLDRGWIGVQLFFVLSGFLITGILLDTRDAPNHFHSFYVRRALRILPLYYAALLMLLVVLPALHLAAPSTNGWLNLSLWLHYFNWIHALYPGESSVPHFWSLAVEEQFYLVWPFLVYRRTPQQVLRLCAAIAALSLLSRVGLLWWFGPGDYVYEHTLSHMDALALGAAGAAVLRRDGGRAQAATSARLLAAGGAVFVLGAIISWGYRVHGWLAQTLGYSLLALSFALWIVAAARADQRHERWQKPLHDRLLGQVGDRSYAMYVLHYPLHTLVGLPLLRTWGWDKHVSMPLALAYLAAAIAATWLAAVATHHLIEAPFLRLRPRFAAARG